MRRLPVSSRFKTTAAAGALAIGLLAMPQAAYAANECGHLTKLEDTLCKADQTYNTGIDYFALGNITLNLEDGLVVNSDVGYLGIQAFAVGGSVVINGAGADVHAQAGHGIEAFATGDIDIDIGNVSTYGDHAYGINSYTEYGNTVINADSVTNSGYYAMGIRAQSTLGNISISAGSVDTAGFASDGITVFTGGNIDISAGDISGEGDYVWGINSWSGGFVEGEYRFSDTNIDVGSINISGAQAAGVNALSYGNLNVKVDELHINGENARGILAAAFGDVTVEVGNASFTGLYAGGILAFSEFGTATAKVENYTAQFGGGIAAFSIEGNAFAEANKVVINGDFTIGIAALSTIGDATINVNEVSNSGYWGMGVNGDAMKGHLAIDAGKITTNGDFGFGIRAFGKSSEINVSGPISTNGFYAFGILNATTHGDAVVRTNGTVKTTGDYADAMLVVGRYGTADIKTNDKISTSGIHAAGIRGHGEDGQVVIVAGEVETSGDVSDGINARTIYAEIFLGQDKTWGQVPFTGNIDITAESVKVSGAGSAGISARGLGEATIDVATVSSASGFAIETNMIEDTSINVRESATSEYKSAILAEGENAFVTVASGATVAGGDHGIIIKAVGDRCKSRPPEDGSPNPCVNPGQEYGYPRVEPLPEVAGNATITNAGTISGGTGYAVYVENGTLTLNNNGTIKGAVLLGIGDDVFNNSGTFIVTKDSDFGAGNDTFKNNGTLSFGNSTAFAIGTAADVKLLGLDKFENNGLVDLRNGVAGDSLTISGVYVGGGQLGLDVNFASNEADKLVIGGAATGTTEIVLNVAAGAARLSGDTGITVIEVGPNSSADAFKLAEGAEDVGFIRYGLTFDGATYSYQLAASAGGGAYRQLNALEGLASNWHASADAVRTNVTGVRDEYWANGATTDGNRLWGQVLAGKESRDGDTGGATPVDFDYDLDRTGAQVGFDFLGSQGDGKSFRFGVTGGFAEATLDSRVVKEKTRVETINFGAYASFTSGTLFGSLLAKYDQHEVKFDSDAAGFEAKADGSTWGLEAEGGMHFAKGSWFIEPLASLAWTRTSLDELEALGQMLDFDDASGVRGKLGVRFGGHSGAGNGGTLRYHGSVKAVHDFGSRNSLTLVSGGEQAELEGDRLGTFGETVLGASYLTKGGLEAFVEGQGELGSDYDSVEGRIGVRFKL